MSYLFISFIGCMLLIAILSFAILAKHVSKSDTLMSILIVYGTSITIVGYGLGLIH